MLYFFFTQSLLLLALSWICCYSFFTLCSRVPSSVFSRSLLLVTASLFFLSLVCTLYLLLLRSFLTRCILFLGSVVPSLFFLNPCCILLYLFFTLFHPFLHSFLLIALLCLYSVSVLWLHLNCFLRRLLSYFFTLSLLFGHSLS